MDKSYYDYDYDSFYDERVERLKTLKPKTNEELQSKLTRMGFGNIMAKSQPMTAEEMQQIAMCETADGFVKG